MVGLIKSIIINHCDIFNVFYQQMLNKDCVH